MSVGDALAAYAPAPLAVAGAVLGLVLGVLYWARANGRPAAKYLVRVDDDRAADVLAAVRSVLSTGRGRGAPARAELAEVLLFYERWLNLEAEQRSIMREELFREGVDMIKLGETIRALLDELPE